MFGCLHLKKYSSAAVRLQQLFKMAMFSLDTQSSPLQHTYGMGGCPIMLVVPLTVCEEECLLRVLVVHFTKRYCKCYLSAGAGRCAVQPTPHCTFATKCCWNLLLTVLYGFFRIP